MNDAMRVPAIGPTPAFRAAVVNFYQEFDPFLSEEFISEAWLQLRAACVRANFTGLARPHPIYGLYVVDAVQRRILNDPLNEVAGVAIDSIVVADQVWMQ